MADEDPDKELTAEQLRDALKRVRSENAERRTTNRELSEQAIELKTRLDKIDADKKTAEEEEARKRGEHEKLANDAKAELESERRSNAQKAAAAKKAVVQAALRAQVTDLIDPDLVSMIDLKGVEVDDDFTIKGLDDVVKTFREAKPALFKTADPPPPGTTNRNGFRPSGSTPPGGKTENWADSDKSLDELVAEHKASLR